jgi:hypothetical protein
MDDVREEVIDAAPEIHQQLTPPPSESHVPGSAEARTADNHGKRMDTDEDITAPDMLSPISADGEKQDEHDLPALSSTDLSSPSMGYDFSNVRVCLNPRYNIFANFNIN